MSNERIELYEFDKFRLDVSERILWREGDRVPLSEKAFETLCVLVRRGGHLVGKDELLEAVWPDAIVEENNLDKNISFLRQVLGERAGKGKFIETVRGHGYRFVPEVFKLENTKDGTPDLAESSTVADRPTAIESNVPDSESATDAQSEIKNLKFEISENPAITANKAGKKGYLLAAGFGLFAAAAVILIWFYAGRGGVSSDNDPVKTIAVLPFKPLVEEDRNEALEMGMTDTLISKLGGGGEIRVLPFSSVRRYTALDQDSVKAGRELETQAVLDGTIQISGGRIRISARLVQTSDGRQLWKGQFDEELTDIFTVQDTISEKVAMALKIRLAGKERKRYTENVEAYQLYTKGRFHLLKGVNSEIELGISYFQQAIEADPNYALAYTGLSDAYRGRSVGGEMPSSEFMPKAKAAASRAIEIDETLAEAHANLGHIIFWYDWDWAGAEAQHKRALELDPNSPDTLQFYAHMLSATGRHSEALAKIKLARELDPVNLRVNAIEGMLLLHAGQIDEAIIRLEKTLELDPNYRVANMMAARAYTEKGMFAEAIAATKKARELSAASSEPIAYGAYALAKSGKSREARAALDEMVEFLKTRWVPPYNFALVYNALGESSKALDYLKKGFAGKDVRMVFLKVEPKWNNLRNEPRFIELMRRMNLGF